MSNPCVKHRQWLLERKNEKKKEITSQWPGLFVPARSFVLASSASLASPKGLGKPSPDSQSFSGMLWNDDRALM